MRISDWVSDVCSSDLCLAVRHGPDRRADGAPNSRGPGADDRHEAARNRRGSFGLQFFQLVPVHSRFRELERLPAASPERTEERRVGKEVVRTVRYRWSPYT